MENNELSPPVGAVTNNLADILERVLDKGIVIAGDIKIQLADVDLLNIKIRLLITSVDRAKELGIDWWHQDDFYSSLSTPQVKQLQAENNRLRRQLKSGAKKNSQKFSSRAKSQVKNK